MANAAPTTPDAAAPDTSAPSAGVPGIYAALDQLNRTIRALPKSERNITQGYAFRGIDQLYDMLHPMLAEAGVITVPKTIVELRSEQRVRSNGGPINYVLVRRVYRFLCLADGSFEDVEGLGEALDTGDKAANKAQSNAHKYAFFQLFTIPTDEPEADHEHVEAAGSWQGSGFTGWEQPADWEQPSATRLAGPAQGQGPAFTLDTLTDDLANVTSDDGAAQLQRRLIEAMRTGTVSNAEGGRAMKLIKARRAEFTD